MKGANGVGRAGWQRRDICSREIAVGVERDGDIGEVRVGIHQLHGANIHRGQTALQADLAADSGRAADADIDGVVGDGNRDGKAIDICEDDILNL